MQTALRSQTASRWRSGLWDRIGIGLSGLCAVHCLLMPLALATLPFWPGDFVHTWLHLVFAVLLIPITLLAMWTGMQARAPRAVPGLLASGLVLVLTATLAHEVLGATGETLVTLAGSLLLVAGHWWNWRVRHQHDG